MRTLTDFRAWALSQDFPEEGRIDYINGQIEVDMSPEDLFCHGTPKTEIVVVVGGRIRRLGLGHLFSDRTRVSSNAANFSAEPDVVFLSHQTLRNGRAKLVPKATTEDDRFVEIEGAVDLIVEIISDSSERKDKQRLPPAYFAAGVAEFWLIDARKRDLLFQIHARGKSAFRSAKLDAEGFQRSTLLNCSYRLTRNRVQGLWSYVLLEKPGPRRRKSTPAH
jgi:Uma2 family endonuclease